VVAQTAHFCVSGAIRTLRKYAFDTNRVFMRWLLDKSTLRCRAVRRRVCRTARTEPVFEFFGGHVYGFVEVFCGLLLVGRPCLFSFRLC
jgi:hypothetical protein